MACNCYREERLKIEIFMSVLTPLFVDVSTVRFCPRDEIERIVQVEGYHSRISEEALASVENLECATWLRSLMMEKLLTSHQIVNGNDIRLLLHLSKRCGACRSEVSSYVGAAREEGIVITKDPKTRKFLQPHFPEVKAFGPDEFLRYDGRMDERELFPDKKVLFPSASRTPSLNKFKSN